MRKIIDAAILTPEEKTEFVKFQILTIPKLRQEGDTILDDLNRQIKFIKGIDILTYYTPTDPNKENKPLLNRNLQRKWLPQKTVDQKQQKAKQSITRAINILKQGPKERERARKKSNKDQKMHRCIIRCCHFIQISLYSNINVFLMMTPPFSFGLSEL